MQNHHIRGERIESSYTHASARGFVLRLRAGHADRADGFKPVETWFAAADFVAKPSGISLDETGIEFEAPSRQTSFADADPPCAAPCQRSSKRTPRPVSDLGRTQQHGIPDPHSGASIEGDGEMIP
ncbi:hypothetical protein [Methylococcus geothermalis]|uniref:hypothetical protein n=1 Tax=Methylococcus geothermalis TaxID=2681310 RepID=UPI001469C3B1|nr:hypothetical protein [Methylococcus geothermalis]